MRVNPRRLGVALALTVATAAAYCTSPTRPFECTPSRIEPDTLKLAAGDTASFHLDLANATCLPPDTAAATRRWALFPASDTTVARIDSLSGLVTAEAPGSTAVWAYTTMTHGELGVAFVTVTP